MCLLLSLLGWEGILHGFAEEWRLWTDILLKCYNIKKTTPTPYHAAANGVVGRDHRPIADALSKLTSCSCEPKDIWFDYYCF